MICSDTVRNLLDISALPPFDRLTESELLLVAQHVRRRHYAPGEVLLEKGVAAERLVIVVGGSVLIDGRPAPAVFDAESVLFGLPILHDYIAGADGAEVLGLAKPHLFTIARECPDFIVGMATLGQKVIA